jgi:hypothetical protein
VAQQIRNSLTCQSIQFGNILPNRDQSNSSVITKVVSSSKNILYSVAGGLLKISSAVVCWLTSIAFLRPLLVFVLILVIRQSSRATTRLSGLSGALLVGFLAVIFRLIFSDAVVIHVGYAFLVDLVLGGLALLAFSYIITIGNQAA